MHDIVHELRSEAQKQNLTNGAPPSSQFFLAENFRFQILKIKFLHENIFFLWSIFFFWQGMAMYLPKIVSGLASAGAKTAKVDQIRKFDRFWLLGGAAPPSSQKRSNLGKFSNLVYFGSLGTRACKPWHDFRQVHSHTLSEKKNWSQKNIFFHGEIWFSKFEIENFRPKKLTTGWCTIRKILLDSVSELQISTHM